jgi:insertion element IS1 protein InsB
MMERYECRLCGEGMVRKGRIRSGKQRYYCRHCKKTIQLEYFYKACNPKINNSLALLVTESCGIRSICRILKISTSTVIRKIIRIAKRIIRPFPILQGKEYEVDEVRTYIGNKQRLYWILTILSG